MPMWSGLETRPPPPTGPPPRYAAVVTKVYPYSLRPVMFFTSFLGFIWALAMGIISIRDRGSENETSKEKIFDLVLAILYLVVAAVEVFGMVVASLQKISLARILLVAAPLGIIVAFADQLLQVILHFTLKNDIISQCVANTQGETLTDGFDGTEIISADEATSLCHDAWSHGIWTVIVWLIFTTVLSLFFGSVAIAYYRQLLDPSSVRTRTRPNVPQAFPLQSGPYYPPPNGQQPWMVPPYPGPPAGRPSQFEKSDYHPEAEWAQGETVGFAPPPGPPPARNTNPFDTSNPFENEESISRSRVVPNREEDEAWERARSEGVTAHLTGHAPAPLTTREESSGYVIGNREEDEAWERAREEGLTAHLTGKRGGEGSV
ncbi:hypothetical protein TREMEDRAFT_73651 [Tremella mesenterica DSM 1558]|uniref:uncharacterized protein n=1 Tax=Tremella mesenterica (strain ATCC 24925 / CBS 8224 / DSM 1558 / NBRC 9311 / NRRL Y-6157 / RJB 2259-6 / UBC 559-6) TaxID=578456 RepID=UPI0003F4A5D6|nr:uncharacterized protein TREMEDRAFT_73651 [Tremella mesenterica DSM 1558]EIW69892.1 hypothetical protein TREMEDRAFT_73651 [Tremella mesenterica DSM 1558]